LTWPCNQTGVHWIWVADWHQQSLNADDHMRKILLRRLSTSPAGAVAQYCDEHVCVSVCLSVCEDISGTTRAIFTKFLCMLPMSVARCSSGMLTIGRTAYRREGGDGSAQRGRSVIYDCLVSLSRLVGIYNRPFYGSAWYGYCEYLFVNAHITRRVLWTTILSGWILHDGLNLARQFASLSSWARRFLENILIYFARQCSNAFKVLWDLWSLSGAYLRVAYPRSLPQIAKDIYWFRYGFTFT